jgi:hypothetical protein
MKTTMEQFKRRLLSTILSTEEHDEPITLEDGSIEITVYCTDHQSEYGEADCDPIKVTISPEP